MKPEQLTKREVLLELNKDYSDSTILEAKMNHRGFIEDPEVCSWLSQLFEKEVYLIRAEAERRRDIDKVRIPGSLETDKIRGFLTGAPIHVVSEKSVEALTKLIESKYKNDPTSLAEIDTSEIIFRPSFVIDAPEAYLEEEY